MVPDKAERVHNFHRNTLKALSELLAAAGLEYPYQLTARHLARRTSTTEIKLLSQIHTFLEPGALLRDDPGDEFYAKVWNMARADSFDPDPKAQSWA